MITCFIINNGIVKKKITEENGVVTSKALKIPLDCDKIGRRDGFYKLQYNGRLFVKRGNRIICESMVGKNEVDTLTSSGMDRLVFLNEYEESNDFLYRTLLGLFGTVIVYKGWNK